MSTDCTNAAPAMGNSPVVLEHTSALLAACQAIKLTQRINAGHRIFATFAEIKCAIFADPRAANHMAALYNGWWAAQDATEPPALETVISHIDSKCGDVGNHLALLAMNENSQFVVDQAEAPLHLTCPWLWCPPIAAQVTNHSTSPARQASAGTPWQTIFSETQLFARLREAFLKFIRAGHKLPANPDHQKMMVRGWSLHCDDARKDMSATPSIHNGLRK